MRYALTLRGAYSLTRAHTRHRRLKTSAPSASPTGTSIRSCACLFPPLAITRCTFRPIPTTKTHHRVSELIRFSRCESCIERLFTLGPAPCPTCSVVLRKSGFKIQTFEDLKVEEEVAVRRRIAKQYVLIADPVNSRSRYES
jgi:hypothetical protein